MKKILTSLLLLSCTLGKAQYFQKFFNYNNTTVNARAEVFQDGLCTRNNFIAGNSVDYYNVAIGFTKVSELPPSGDTVNNEVRFVRTGKGGLPVTQNFGYSLAKNNSTQWLHGEAHSICEIPSTNGTGGYMVVGRVANNSSNGASVLGGADALIMRIDTSGNARDRFRLNFYNGFDELNAVIASQFTPGIFYACGTSNKSSYSRMVVVKFTSSGGIIWAKNYHFDNTSPSTYTNFCSGKGIAEDPADGSLYVAGLYYSPTSSSAQDGLVVKLDTSGSVSFVRSHHLASHDEYRSIKVTSDHNLMLCGFSNLSPMPGLGYYDMWITKMNTSGATVFSKILSHQTLTSGWAESRAYDLVERINTTGQPEFFIAGSQLPEITPIDRNVICKIDSSGIAVGCYSYLNLNNDNDYGMGIDFAPASMTSPGIRLFSNVFDTTNTLTSNGYILKTYFNGATCSGYCPSDPVFTTSVSPVSLSLEDKVLSTFTKNQLATKRTNYKSISYCSQSTVSCGSNLRETENNESLKQEMNLTIYPNPASEMLSLASTVELSGATIYILNALGQQVKNPELISNQGEQKATLNISELASGIYFLKIEQNGRSAVTRFYKK